MHIFNECTGEFIRTDAMDLEEFLNSDYAFGYGENELEECYSANDIQYVLEGYGSHIMQWILVRDFKFTGIENFLISLPLGEHFGYDCSAKMWKTDGKIINFSYMMEVIDRERILKRLIH